MNIRNRLRTAEMVKGTHLASTVRILDEAIKRLGTPRDVFSDNPKNSRLSAATQARAARTALWTDMYQQGLSLRQIAAVCAVDHRTIENELKASGLKLRDSKTLRIHPTARFKND